MNRLMEKGKKREQTVALEPVLSDDAFGPHLAINSNNGCRARLLLDRETVNAVRLWCIQVLKVQQ